MRSRKALAVAFALFPPLLAAAPADLPAIYTKSLGVRMLRIQAGKFRMGNEGPTDPDRLKQSPVLPARDYAGALRICTPISRMGPRLARPLPGGIRGRSSRAPHWLRASRARRRLEWGLPGPKSVSRDGGRTWTVSKTPFPALGKSQQRPALLRLASGRLFFASHGQIAEGKQPAGIGKRGAYVALSVDDGKIYSLRPQGPEGGVAIQRLAPLGSGRLS